VIGAGSVVTKNIPANVIAVGNPCKVLRQITDDDKLYYFKKLKLE
jgi:acetyltransferase-like isoleucine patch superfamily enzyme